jgi:HEPN domain-containing protein
MSRSRRSEALRWLTQAEDELKDAEMLAKAQRYYLALFLCQQSAEKALKAFIYDHIREPVFTHSVAELLKIAESIDPTFKPASDVKRLDDYYIPTRYPNGLPGEVPSRYFDSSDEAVKALALAKEVFEHARQRILKK